MSESEALTSKAKKAKRSEERFKKGKKRKRDEPADVPAQRDEEEEEAVLGAGNVEDNEKGNDRRVDKTTKKPKRDAKNASHGLSPEQGVNAAASDPDPAQISSRKRRKNKTEAEATGATVDDKDASGEKSQAPSTEQAAAAKQRFIVFIGNLPFTATTEGVTTHFASIAPTSIRHLSDPATGKSKGYAFLEFANYDRMKTCLKLYHHSTFDSGVGGERGKRRINVELTAGGGGKSEQRKGKLKEKNTRLEEQRKRRAEAEMKQENRKAKKNKGAGGGKIEAVDDSGGTEQAAEGIHPARLAMMSKGR